MTKAAGDKGYSPPWTPERRALDLGDDKTPAPSRTRCERCNRGATTIVSGQELCTACAAAAKRGPRTK